MNLCNHTLVNIFNNIVEDLRRGVFFYEEMMSPNEDEKGEPL